MGLGRVASLPRVIARPNRGFGGVAGVSWLGFCGGSSYLCGGLASFEDSDSLSLFMARLVMARGCVCPVRAGGRALSIPARSGERTGLVRAGFGMC